MWDFAAARERDGRRGELAAHAHGTGTRPPSPPESSATPHRRRRQGRGHLPPRRVRALAPRGSPPPRRTPAEGQTLLVYDAPVAVFRFPLEPGAQWSSAGEVNSGILRGLPYAAATPTTRRSTARARSILPTSFTQALRVRTTVTVSPAAGNSPRSAPGRLRLRVLRRGRARHEQGRRAAGDFTTAAEVRSPEPCRAGNHVRVGRVEEGLLTAGRSRRRRLLETWHGRARLSSAPSGALSRRVHAHEGGATWPSSTIRSAPLGLATKRDQERTLHALNQLESRLLDLEERLAEAQQRGGREEAVVAMDITPFLDLKIAPRAVFDALAERQTRVRFMVPDAPTATGARDLGRVRRRDPRARALPRPTGLEARATARAIFAPNRVEWIERGARHPGRGRRDGARSIRRAPPSRSATSSQHSDAKVIFVDTPALLGRVFEALERARRRASASCSSTTRSTPRACTSRCAPRASTRAGVRGGRAQAHHAGRARPRHRRRARPRGPARVRAHDERASRSISPALMLYTSGTSGNPKGVPLTHRNVGGQRARLAEVQRAARSTRARVDLLWLPMSHIFGFGEACLGNSLGWTTYLADPASVPRRASPR